MPMQRLLQEWNENLWPPPPLPPPDVPFQILWQHWRKRAPPSPPVSVVPTVPVAQPVPVAPAADAAQPVPVAPCADAAPAADAAQPVPVAPCADAAPAAEAAGAVDEVFSLRTKAFVTEMNLTTRQIQRSEVGTLLGIDVGKRFMYGKREDYDFTIKYVVKAEHPFQALAGSYDVVNVLVALQLKDCTTTSRARALVRNQLVGSKYKSLCAYYAHSADRSRPIDYFLGKEELLDWLAKERKNEAPTADDVQPAPDVHEVFRCAQKMCLTTRQIPRSEFGTLLGIDLPLGLVFPASIYCERWQQSIKMVVNAKHPFQALVGSFDLVDFLMNVHHPDSMEAKRCIGLRVDPSKYRSLMRYNVRNHTNSYFLSKEDLLSLWHNCSEKHVIEVSQGAVTTKRSDISWRDPPTYDKVEAYERKRHYDQVH